VRNLVVAAGAVLPFRGLRYSSLPPRHMRCTATASRGVPAALPPSSPNAAPSTAGYAAHAVDVHTPIRPPSPVARPCGSRQFFEAHLLVGVVASYLLFRAGGSRNYSSTGAAVNPHLLGNFFLTSFLLFLSFITSFFMPAAPTIQTACTSMLAHQNSRPSAGTQNSVSARAHRSTTPG
jgi:hypothetical protein